MESGELMRLNWVNAESGTAFAGVELLAEFEVEALAVSAFDGATCTPDEGVYWAEAVVAFEPAETELVAA
jgi:hypothetical protein